MIFFTLCTFYSQCVPVRILPIFAKIRSFWKTDLVTSPHSDKTTSEFIITKWRYINVWEPLFSELWGNGRTGIVMLHSIAAKLIQRTIISEPSLGITNNAARHESVKGVCSPDVCSNPPTSALWGSMVNVSTCFHAKDDPCSTWNLVPPRLLFRCFCVGQISSHQK